MLNASTCHRHMISRLSASRSAVARLAVTVALILTPAFALAAAPMGKDVTLMAPVGVPLGSATVADPWTIDFATPPAVQGGAPVIMTVNITNLPAQMVGESIQAASKRKATTIAAAINKVLPKVNGMAAATVGQQPLQIPDGFTAPKFNKQGKLVTPAMPKFKTIMQSVLTVNGLYSIPDTKGMPGSGTPAFKQLNNPTKEFGDGGALLPGQPGMPPPPSSSGSTGSMSGSSMSMPASGLDSTGAQSFVYLGFVSDLASGQGVYAAVLPYAGETDYAVLQSLGAQLDQFGLGTAFSSSTDTLYITTMIPAGDTLVFGNTDTNLDFGVSQTLAAPEPSAWSLMLLGFGALGMGLRSRRKIAAGA